jgi:hypothetical protein
MPTDDARFFVSVSEFMTTLSGEPVPTGTTQTMEFFTLLSSAYNIEENAIAQQYIDFLFYIAKAGEHYSQHVSSSQFRFTPIDFTAEYEIAREYLAAAEKVLKNCEVCAEQYPDFVMPTLPEGAVRDMEAVEFTGRLTF